MDTLVQVFELLFFVLLCGIAWKGYRTIGQKNLRGVSRLEGLKRVHAATTFTRRVAITPVRQEPQGHHELAVTRRDQWAVLYFSGDSKATGKEGFATLVDEVITNKSKFKGAIVVVNSPGGGVAEYGQMYAEMLRLRKAQIEVRICVDTYAASGGYLMSLPGNRIIAAPFAYVGSVGVVTEFPNFYKLLKTIGVEPMTFTAGNMKRTITAMSNPDDAEKREAFQAKLEKIHEQFKSVVLLHRPNVNPDLLNGDAWTAAESVKQNMGLVDEIATSQEYLFDLNQTDDLIVLGVKKNRFESGILRLITGALDHGMNRVESRFRDQI